MFVDNVVFLWCQDAGSNGEENNLVSDAGNKESWSVVKVLRGHLEDIYDLCWSRDSNYIVTGSVDNSAIVWDVQKGAAVKECMIMWVCVPSALSGQQVSALKESRQYVQGVAWDPLGKVVVSMSNDRY
jgi:chromatin assembly factor 1 subunit B